MKRRNVAFDPDLAEGSLEIVALAYASVPSYDAGWEQIHPEDQAEWLAAFKAVRDHLAQLVVWHDEARLDEAQRERFLYLQRQTELVEAVLARLDSDRTPSRPAQARAAAFLSLVLDD
ncbi:hypothetical protein D3C72_109320 [compost metagenome]